MARAVCEAVLRSLAEGRPGSEDAARAHVRHRREQVERLTALADGHGEAYLPGRERRGHLRASQGGRPRGVPQRSREAGALPPASHRHGRCDAVEAVADPRPALRVGASRRGLLEERAARQGGSHHGSAPGRVVCFHHRHGQRLGGEADRRLSQRRAGTRRAGRQALDGRLRAADRHRDLPRTLSEELRAAGAAQAGKVERYRWTLPDVDHVFLPGHRIMVQVQSTLFPLYDRNPQTYVENIMYAKPGDYKKATQSIWFGGPTRARWCCRWCPESRPVFRRGGALSPPPRRKFVQYNQGAFSGRT